MRKLLVIAVLTIACAWARADTTYTYNGNPFTTIADPSYYILACAPNCAISGSFTLSQPLAGNLSDVIISPTAFSFTDGSGGVTVANTSPVTPTFDNNSNDFEVSTDAYGHITGWHIELSVVTGELANNGGVQTFFVLDTSTFPGILPDPREPNTVVDDVRAYGGTLQTGYALVNIGYNTDAPGTWTESSSSVPEPSTILLLGSGLLGGIGAFRRKLLSN